MASADSRALNLPGPPPAGAKPSGRWQIAALLTCLFLFCALPWLHGRVGTWLGPATTAFIMLLACVCWTLHLRRGGLPHVWTWLFASLLAGQWIATLLHQSTPVSVRWLSSLGCGVFVYAMLWVFATHERDPGLRSLATVALLLSIGVLAKPAVLIACALLTLCFFLEEGRSVGGFVASVLLLLTPVLLCALTLITLNALIADSFAHIEWLGPTTIDPSLLPMPSQVHKLPAAWFGLSVVLSRLFARKGRLSDLAYVALTTFVATAGVAHWMPDRISTLDLSMVIAGGAAILLALDPPRNLLGRLMVTAGLGWALFSQIGLR